MDRLSRRDAVYEQLGALREALRPIEASSAPSDSPLTTRAALERSTSLGGIAQANDNTNRYLERLSSTLQGGPLRSTLHVPNPSNNNQSVYSAMGRLSATPSQSSFELPTESLPVYFPAETSQPVKYLHSLTSPSGKMELQLESVGPKQHPIYIQGVCTAVSGKLRLRLQGEQNVNEVRIRVKGEPLHLKLSRSH